MPYDCGVVAAFNAASWCNVYKPYEEIEKIAKSCGYSPNKGIWPFQFSKLMKKLGIPAKKVRPKSMEDMESQIYLGKFFILLYMCPGRISGHVITLFCDHNGSIKLINPEPEGEILAWDDLAAEIEANGMKEFHVYEIPHRKLVRVATGNDDSRSA